MKNLLADLYVLRENKHLMEKLGSFTSHWLLFLSLTVATFTSHLLSSSPLAANDLGTEVPITNHMEVGVGKATILKMDKAPKRIAVSNPGIAYVVMISPTEIEIIGRNPGRTNIFMWIPTDEEEQESSEEEADKEEKSSKGKKGSKSKKSSSIERKPPKIIGTELNVGIPPPAYFNEGSAVEVLNGSNTELLFLSNPSENVRGAKYGRTANPATDMPEPCLAPGCL